MGAGNSRKIIIAQLTGPAKTMALMYGEQMVQQIELWSKVSSFPKMGSLSVKVLDLVKIELQQFEESDVGKKTKIDWDSFSKWLLEAQSRECEVEDRIVAKLAAKMASAKLSPSEFPQQHVVTMAPAMGEAVCLPPPFCEIDPFIATSQALPPCVGPSGHIPPAGNTQSDTKSDTRMNLPYLACPNPIPNGGNDELS